MNNLMTEENKYKYKYKHKYKYKWKYKHEYILDCTQIAIKANYNCISNHQ